VRPEDQLRQIDRTLEKVDTERTKKKPNGEDKVEDEIPQPTPLPELPPVPRFPLDILPNAVRDGVRKHKIGRRRTYFVIIQRKKPPAGCPPGVCSFPGSSPEVVRRDQALLTFEA
jgi:hypothetical protein